MFFRFIGRLVVFEVLRGGACIFGRRFHMVGIPAFFRFRERLVVVAELRGGTCILGRRFHMVGIPEGGIF